MYYKKCKYKCQESEREKAQPPGCIAFPCCKNKRLFDADLETEGIIKIKCPICNAVVAVSFHKKTIRTERIGA